MIFKYSSSEIYFRFFEISSCVSTSNDEPNDISRKWTKSFSEFLADPSAIFEAIETEALLSWSIKPNLSDGGNNSVSL